MSDDKRPVTATIRVSVSRDYGAERVEFSAELVVRVTTKEERHTEYAKLVEAMWAEHNLYTKEFLPAVPNSKQKPVQSTDGVGEWHPASEIVLELKNGKKYWSVKGGKYAKHGVRIWDETLKREGILEEVEENNGLKLEDTEMFVVDTGKGLKVTKLRKAEIG